MSQRHKWWRCPGLNGGPAAYESAALPTELHRHVPQTGRGLYHGRTAGDKPFCLLGGISLSVAQLTILMSEF